MWDLKSYHISQVSPISNILVMVSRHLAYVTLLLLSLDSSSPNGKYFQIFVDTIDLTMSAAEERARLLPEDGHKNYQSVGQVESQEVAGPEKTADKASLGILLCVLSGFFLIAGWGTSNTSSLSHCPSCCRNTLTKLASIQTLSISSWQLLLLR